MIDSQKSESSASLHAKIRHFADACRKLRGNTDPTLFLDTVLSLFFLRVLSARKRTGRKIPLGCAYTDLLALARTQGSLQLLGDRVFIKLFEANSMVPFKALCQFDEWERSKLRALIRFFAGGDVDWSCTHLTGRVYEILWLMLSERDRKETGVFTNDLVYNTITSELIKYHAPDQPKIITVYDPICGNGALLLGVANALGDNRSMRLRGHASDSWDRTHAILAHVICGYYHSKIEVGNPIQLESGDRPEPLYDLFEDHRPQPGFDIVIANLMRHEMVRNRFKGGKFALYWSALDYLINRIKPDGTGVCIIPEPVFKSGGMEGGHLTQHFRGGRISEFIKLPTPVPSFAVVLRGRHQLGARETGEQ